MAETEQKPAETDKEDRAERDDSPKCLVFAQKGITTGNNFAGMMSALMTDLIEGKITPGVGNAVCNAGGKLLKVVEMQAKYGQSGKGTTKTLILTEPS